MCNYVIKMTTHVTASAPENYEDIEGIKPITIKFTGNLSDVGDETLPHNLLGFKKLDSLKIDDFYFKIELNEGTYDILPSKENFIQCAQYTCKHAKMYLTHDNFIVFTEYNGYITSVGLYNNT